MSSTPRGGLGTFWRRICTAPSAFRPPRLLHGRAASYGSIIVWQFQEVELFNFQGTAWPLVKAYQKFFRSGSDWEYTTWCTLSTPFFESAYYNDNLDSSLTGVTSCHTSQVFYPSGTKNAGRQSQSLPNCFCLPVFHMLPYQAAFCFILLSDPQCPENLCLLGRELSPLPPLPGPEPRQKPGGCPHWAAP